jgi:hypothetical protein
MDHQGAENKGKQMASVVPVAKALTVCDYHVGYSNGKVDLYGLFNAIRSQTGFPYTRGRFCVFAQLINGLGHMPFFIDIRFAETDELVWTTEVRQLQFPDRTTIVQMAMTIEGCRFERPGLYVLELFCDNTWVSDTQVLLR